MNLLLLSLGLGAVPKFLGPSAKHIGFVPTAGDVYEDPYFVREDRQRLTKLGFVLEDIDLTSGLKEKIIQQISSVDAVFVAGGNSFYLMQQLIAKDVANDFRQLLLEGLPYIGASAGAVICGPSLEPVRDLDDPTAAPDLPDMSGLNLTSFVVLPHYGKEKYLPKYRKIISEFENQFLLVPIRDDQAVLVTERDSHQIISSPSVPIS
ncbi:MAG: Type 1 glutamine amidotransferase-like domain-containing protein [Thermoleophilia bacterium]